MKPVNLLGSAIVSLPFLYPSLGTVRAGEPNKTEPVASKTNSTSEERSFFNRSTKCDPRKNLSLEKFMESLKGLTKEEKAKSKSNYYFSIDKHLEFAKRRCDLDRKEYHPLFVGYESDKNLDLEDKICRAYIPNNPKGKSLFILISGMGEKLHASPQISGMSNLYHRLVKEDKGIVLWFRTGFVMDGINSMLLLDGNYAYDLRIIRQHTKNIAEDLIKKYRPSHVSIAGFSWGGGEVLELASDDSWRQGVSVERTVLIDAITSGLGKFGVPASKRPNFSESKGHKHFHIYQRPANKDFLSNLFTLYGGALDKVEQKEGDKIWQLSDVNHAGIDTIPEVLERSYRFLTEKQSKHNCRK